MKKLLYVFVTKCKTAGRYGVDNCLFNAKLIFSILFLLNMLSVTILLIGRRNFLEMVPAHLTNRVFLLIFCILLTFTSMSIIYPKRTILDVKMSDHEVKQLFGAIILYIFFSVIVFSLSIWLRE